MVGLKAWWQRLVGKSGEEAAVDVIPEVETVANEESLADAAPAAPVSVNDTPCSGSFFVGWRTDVGRVRGHNEDALFVFSGEQNASNAVPPFGLFIAADGMGGHQAGEVASSLAVRTTSYHLLSQVYLPMLAGLDRGADQPSLTEVMRESITQANRLVTQDLPGSGCTLTCGMILGERLFIGHVGDSRAYLLRADEPMKQLTNDHSLVNRLIEMGQLTEEEAAVHPQRNVLYRAIGQGGGLEVDVATYTVKPGDQLLLCTDGLWGMLEDAEIVNLIDAAASPRAACDGLVAAANAAGGNDNITVVLLQLCANQNNELFDAVR